MLIDVLNYRKVDTKEAEVLKHNAIGIKVFKHHEVFKKIIKQNKFTTMVEVGTFLGVTARKIAPLVEKYYTVDTFNFKPLERFYPMTELEKTFLRNTYCIRDKIIPIKGTSWEVGRLFQKLGIKVDIVYIDADHHYKSVVRDIRSWFGVGKFMCGDDYHLGRHKNLIKAVNDFAEKHNLTVVNIDNDFWYYE